MITVVLERKGRLVDCPKCGASDCIEIEIRLQEEHDVQFHSCRRCEAKWWERGGAAIALGDVLDLAAKPSR